MPRGNLRVAFVSRRKTPVDREIRWEEGTRSKKEPQQRPDTETVTDWCHLVAGEVPVGAKRGAWRGGHELFSWLSSHCSCL